MIKPVLEKHVLTFQPEILNDDELTCLDRFLLAVIVAYDNVNGCFASNKRIGAVANCSPSSVSKSINKMAKLGYIVVNHENYEKGGRGYVRRVRKDLKRHKLPSK